MTNVQRSRRQVRLSRALGIALTPKAQRIFEKRPYAPGEHGRTRRRTESDYAVRLREKQRLRAQTCRRMSSFAPGVTAPYHHYIKIKFHNQSAEGVPHCEGRVFV